MTTRTQWFETEKPVHVGDYEWDETDLMWYWNGRKWGFFDRETGEYVECWTQDPTWRGLAVKPRSGIKTRSPQAK